MKRILALDIETSPNIVPVWGLFKNNYISPNDILSVGRTICFSYKWVNEGGVVHTRWVEGLESIREIHIALSMADAVVHYNGNKFDIPTLNKEFLLNGFPPAEPAVQIDLYRTVKTNFRFASNKLDYICQQLGIGHKIPNKGMALWRECAEGNKASQREMMDYNAQDVVLVELLYQKLLPWVSSKLHTGVTGEVICPRCGSSNVQSRGVRGLYRRYQCQSCKGWMRRATMEKPALGTKVIPI